MSKNELKIKGKASLEKVIDNIDDILLCLRKGKTYIKKNNEVVCLSPEKEVVFEIEADQKEKYEKISIEISWQKQALQKEKPVEFTVSSIAPKMPEKKEKINKEPKKKGDN